MWMLHVGQQRRAAAHVIVPAVLVTFIVTTGVLVIVGGIAIVIDIAIAAVSGMPSCYGPCHRRAIVDFSVSSFLDLKMFSDPRHRGIPPSTDSSPSPCVIALTLWH